MLIKSRVESGDEGRAVVIRPFSSDQAVCNIRAAIETLNHAHGARRSGLRAAVRGAFAFVAGRPTKDRLPGIDTPVAGAPGRTHAGGMGLLSLAALTFATARDSHAADPGVTSLDEDSIDYKDMPHGSFELVTKEAVPRYLLVEDPGQTVILNRTGTTIGVSQVTNSAARMDELQAAQQEVHANWSKGQGTTGSGTTPLSDTLLPVQPINFTLPEGPGGLNSLPVLPAVEIKAEFIFIPQLPPPTVLTLNLGSGLTEFDTVVFDTFTATSGSFGATSSNSSSVLSYGISGGIPGNSVVGGLTYNVSQKGSFGTLYVNTSTGAYTFVPDDTAINALKAPTIQNFVITVSDGAASASQTFTIDIDGVNDAAVIAGETTGSVGGTPIFTASAAAHAQILHVASGTLTSADVDDPANTFTAVTAPTASDHGYGTFTMTKEGVWTYTLADGNNAVQALNVGDTLTDTFTVTSVDGTKQVVKIAIDGWNDAAVISGDTTGCVVEAAACNPGKPIATGTLTSMDVDNPSDLFTAVHCGKSDGGYGTYTMSECGVWSYKLDNDNCAVQALNVGATLTDTFTVTSVDGTEQVVTITIAGQNDAAVISGDTKGCVVEAAACDPGKPIATGTLTSTDVDNPSDLFTVVNCGKSDGGYGTFTMSACGVWSYKLDNDNCTVQALGNCDTLTDTFTVTSIDGTKQVVTIIIGGQNDAAVISGDTKGCVVEAAACDPGKPFATGALTSTDVDNPSDLFTAVNCGKSDGGYGTYTMSECGLWTYKLDNDNCTVQALGNCDTLTDTFTVTSIDGTKQLVTIIIGGQNDAAVISGDTKGCVVEAAACDPGKPFATGALTSTDVDNPSDLFTAVNCGKSDGGYGTYTMSACGVWNYKLDNDNCTVQALGDCDTLTDTFTVTSIDGTKQVITITIQGADDQDGQHHHEHSDHEWENETSVSFESAAVLGSTAVAGKGSAGVAATQADAKAVVASSPAAAPVAGESFLFKEQGAGSPAPENTLLAGGGKASAGLAEVHETSVSAAVVQMIESGPLQHISEDFTAGHKWVAYHGAHDLVA